MEEKAIKQLENIDPLLPLLLDRLRVFYEAAQNRGALRAPIRHYSIAGLHFQAEMPDPVLADKLLCAFEPMRDDGLKGPADLIWRAFEAPTNLNRGDVSPSPTAPGIHGVIFAGRDHDLIAERQLTCDSVFEPASKTIFTVCWAADELTRYAVAKPLLRFLYLTLYAQNKLVTHAALVGRNDKGIVVTGRGGSGKTTTSAAALLRGFDFVSDDYVCMSKQGARFVGETLFASLMLDVGHIRRFPKLAEAALFPPSDLETKAVVYPMRLFPGQVQRSMNIVAVIVPLLSDHAETRLAPMSKAAALRALAPSSVYSSPWREPSRFDFYHQMLKELPCFHLELGRDVDGITLPLEDLLR